MNGGGVLFLGIEGKTLGAEEDHVLRRVKPAGIVLVSRNIESSEQLRALIVDLRAAAPQAIFCLDAEGGRVDRLRAVVAPAPAAEDLARCSPALARRSGRWIGASLRAFGFDLDFAPVADLEHGLAGNALDGRTYGATPRQVTARARAFLDGLHAAGIAGCVKHFPGLGRASADTHLRGANIAAPEGELARDLTPFTELLHGAESMMVGHGIYPGWDGAHLPASLHPAIAKRLLRRDLGFKGALFSDDLEMGALADFGSLPQLGVLALEAGCDGLLFCRRIDQAPAIAVALGKASYKTRLAEATGRLGRLRGRLVSMKRRAPAAPDLEQIRRRLARLATDVARQGSDDSPP